MEISHNVNNEEHVDESIQVLQSTLRTSPKHTQGIVNALYTSIIEIAKSHVRNVE